MLIGYARVSTQDQTLDLQTDALTSAGCEKIFTDTMSGATSERPGLQDAMTHLRAGDKAIPWWSGVWTGLAAHSSSSSLPSRT